MRQLSLFKGKRQRGERPPAPLEYESHCVLADTIKVGLNPRWRFTHLPMGERRHPATARRLKRMGVTPGWFDFLFCGPGPQVFFLELKRRGSGRLSTEQLALKAHFDACGFDYHVADDVRQAIEQLKLRGIVRTSIGV